MSYTAASLQLQFTTFIAMKGIGLSVEHLDGLDAGEPLFQIFASENCPRVFH